jgi:hypothetical protein
MFPKTNVEKRRLADYIADVPLKRVFRNGPSGVKYRESKECRTELGHRHGIVR